MFLKPQVPQNPTLSTTGLEPVTHQPQQHASACACHHAPAPAPVEPTATPIPVATPGRRSLPTVPTGAIGLALLGGVVLTALLTAVAVSAISVAVAAVVLRSLLRSQHHSHR